MIFRRKRSVRVHLKDDRTLEGVLVSRGDTFVLHAASYLKDEEDSVPVGQVAIPRGNVSFYQVLA